MKPTLAPRRYLPVDCARRVCKLSGVYFPVLKNGHLNDMAADVHRQTETDLRHRPWLGEAMMLEMVYHLPYGLVERPAVRIMQRQIARGKVFPFFANHGVIDEGRYDFRDAPFLALDFFGPAPFSPGCLLDAYFEQLPGQGRSAGS